MPSLPGKGKVDRLIGWMVNGVNASGTDTPESAPLVVVVDAALDVAPVDAFDGSVVFDAHAATARTDPMVAKAFRSAIYAGPRPTGRDGSELHSDHDPGNSATSCPNAASAATVMAAVTPEPQ